MKLGRKFGTEWRLFTGRIQGFVFSQRIRVNGMKREKYKERWRESVSSWQTDPARTSSGDSTVLTPKNTSWGHYNLHVFVIYSVFLLFLFSFYLLISVLLLRLFKIITIRRRITLLNHLGGKFSFSEITLSKNTLSNFLVLLFKAMQTMFTSYITFQTHSDPSVVVAIVTYGDVILCTVWHHAEPPVMWCSFCNKQAQDTRQKG